MWVHSTVASRDDQVHRLFSKFRRMDIETLATAITNILWYVYIVRFLKKPNWRKFSFHDRVKL